MDDEYVDYSCSTPLERLSRDVETLLRSWHIIFSDRHVSFRKPSTKNGNNAAATATATATTPGRTSSSSSLSTSTSASSPSASDRIKSIPRTPPRTPFRSPLRKNKQSNDNNYTNNNFYAPAGDNFHTPPRTRKDLYALEDARNGVNDNIQLIRSGKIYFTTTPPNSGQQEYKDRVTIELDLCLWDGPSSSSTSSKSTINANTSGNNMNRSDGTTATVNNNASNLSLSLRSNCKDPFPKFNILSNLSSLFSIGQHITLSPASLTSIDTLLKPTIEALKEANHPASRNKGQHRVGVSEAFMNLGKNKVNVENNVALQTAALNSISNMLQMALNTATASCDTRIPAFGMWGYYKPNMMKNLTNMNASTNSIEEHGSNDTQETLAHSVMEVPHYLNGGDLFNAASESSVCCMFRKHVENMRMDDVDSDDDDDNSAGTLSGESVGDGGSNYGDDNNNSNNKGSAPTTPGRKNGKRSSQAQKSVPTLNISNPTSPMRKTNHVQHQRRERLYLPAFLSGKCHSGSSFSATGAEFAIHVVPPGVSYPVHCTTLNCLGHLLLQHCPPPSDHNRKIKEKRKLSSGKSKSRALCSRINKQDQALAKVVVSGARHKYTWSKIFQLSEDHIPDQECLLLASPYSHRYQSTWEDFNIMTYGLTWRNSANTQLNQRRCDGNEFDNAVDTSFTISTEQYRQDCRAHVLKMLYQSFCRGKSKRARKALAARKRMEPLWGPYEDPINLVSVDVTWSGKCNSIEKDPLLTLPLRIRSQNTMSSQDILEMENTILSTVFNPLSVASSDFRIGTAYDSNAACTNLSATNRCLLASLIRACSLDQSYLMGHLTNSNILEELHQRDELDIVADEIMNAANISQMTRNLVKAMEWGGMADALDDDAAIHETRMSDIVEQLHLSCAGMEQFPSPPREMFEDSRCESDENDAAFRPYFEQTSGPGRLLSILFTSMSGLQTPSAMAALWMAFISDLRLRWEKKEKLFNLGEIPGLGIELFHQQGNLKGFTNKNVSNGIGSKAKNAAFIHSSEKEPNLNDCIINQKLHVFNIGVESMISIEMKNFQRDRIESEKLSAAFSNETGEDLNPGENQAPPQSIEGGALAREDDFFDAVGTIYDDESTRRDLDTSNNSFDSEMGMSSGHRRGARCPVHNASLSESNDQLFAPYVQRDIPLTDDLIIERRRMFTRKGTDNSTIQSRIEAAHRLQKKKLVSDMSSFKSANPGAVFQDFIAWYGNPENPLHQYEEEALSCGSTDLHGLISPTKTVEEEAFEALYILESTRQFWSDCWNDAIPESAEDQKPLFDAFSTVEMLLLWFESMHPAILINQVLGVNLAMANFILQTSAPPLELRPVKDAMMRLEKKTSDALQLLNNDVMKSISNPINVSFNGDNVDPFAYVSHETVRTCESVVTLIGDVEILISRAISLLSKLNGDIEIVQMILEAPEGRILEARSHQSRAGILDKIHIQQQRNGGNISDDTNALPFPSVREYVLRNRGEEEHPCQLTASIGGTFGLEDGGTNSTKGGLVLALKKCFKK